MLGIVSLGNGPLSPVLKLLLALRRSQASVTIYRELNKSPCFNPTSIGGGGSRTKQNRETRPVCLTRQDKTKAKTYPSKVIKGPPQVSRFALNGCRGAGRTRYAVDLLAINRLGLSSKKSRQAAADLKEASSLREFIPSNSRGWSFNLIGGTGHPNHRLGARDRVLALF